MNKTHVMNLWLGWSTGYRYSDMNNQKDIFKSQPVSAFNALEQLSQLGNLISTVNQHLSSYPLKHSVNVLCNIIPFLSLPGILFCQAVQEGKISVNHRVGSFFNFIAGHLENVVRVAVIAASIGLIVLGNAAYGGAALTGVAYQVIDRMSFVPRRISLFVETYISTISLAGMCLSGTLLVRVISAIALATNIIPFSSGYLHQKIDTFARSCFGFDGPTLKEINAPFARPKKMTFADINQILESDLSDYKINPAHCVQSLINLDDFPPDYAFEKYLTIFNGINWILEPSIKNKLTKNECFIELLRKEFPKADQNEMLRNIDPYIQQIASKTRQTPDQYVTNWLRQQMVQFIEVLQGKKRVIGLQKDLNESIHIYAQLLPYFSSLENGIRINQLEQLGQAMLDFAIDGGSRCALKIKAVAHQWISRIIQTEIPEGRKEDLIEDFEIQMLHTLQFQRSLMVSGMNQVILKDFKEANMPDFLMNMMSDSFRLGLLPMSKFELKRLSCIQVLLWLFHSTDRLNFYDQYQEDLNKVIRKRFSENQCIAYLQEIINSNDQLSGDEKAALLKKFAKQNNEQWPCCIIGPR